MMFQRIIEATFTFGEYTQQKKQIFLNQTFLINFKAFFLLNMSNEINLKKFENTVYSQ